MSALTDSRPKVKDFLKEVCILNPEMYCSFLRLYNAYVYWYPDNTYQIPKSRFKKFLKENDLKECKRNSEPYYKGISLRQIL